MGYETNGLLSGLANGIKEGMITYQNAQNIQHAQKMQELMGGVTRDADGNLAYTPEMQAHRKAGLVTDQQTIANADPDDPHSQRLAATTGGLLNMGNKAIPKDVFAGLSANEIEKAKGLGQADVTGNYGMLKQLYNPLVQVKQGQLEETKSQNAAAAGNKFDNNPIILAANKNIGSLKRSLGVLDNPNKPVTSKDLNLAYNDYINAVAAGGAATEGKISRELPETWATEFNTLKQKAGINDDLRQDPRAQQLISMLRENIRTVHHDLRGAAADQAHSLGTNYAQTSNQKQKAVVNSKVKQYDDAVNEPIAAPNAHPMDEAAVAWARANPKDPRAPMILKQNGVTQ